MKRAVYASLICLFAIVCFTSMGMAQVEEMAIGKTFGVGARTMGMGGASLALSDDFTALYWNPAGMAQIQKFEMFSSLSHNVAIADTYFTGDAVKTTTSRSQMRLNSIGFVYPLETRQGGLAVGFGYNRPQNFDYQTAIQGIDPGSGTDFSGFSVDETNINSGGIGIWSFGASVYVTKQVLVGGSLDFWHGNSLNELDTEATDTQNVDNEWARFRYDDEVDREYSGVGGRIGLLAHLTDTINFGLTLVAPIELGVDEVWYQSTVDVFDDGEKSTDSTSGVQTYDIERPFEIGIGAAVKLFNKQLILAGDVQFTDWTQTRYDPAPADDIPKNNFEEYYATTLQVRLGAEYQIPIIATHIRFGYLRDPIPFRYTEVDTHDFLTAGVGKIFEDSLKLDVTYVLGGWAQERNDVKTENLTHRVFMSAAYRF